MRSYSTIFCLLLLAEVTGGLAGCTSPAGVWFDAAYTDNTPSYDTNPPMPAATGFDLFTQDRGTGERLLLIGHLDINDEMPQFFALDEGFYWVACAVVYEDDTNNGTPGAAAVQPVTVGEGLDVYCHCDLDIVGAARGLYCDTGSDTGSDTGA